MCGIAGILGESWLPADLNAMVQAQAHRGPDGDGVYLDPQRRAGLGHNRLSVIDLSEAGGQPMISPDGNSVITFNGEIYNYLELRRELESAYDFRTGTDTEVLLAAHLKWGEGCLEKLIGMFAFAIWNEHTGSVFAARDRFGVKPFYYHQKNDGTLVFGSEIKSIHAAGVPRIPNEKTWATYLTFGLYDHSCETFWTGINSLPGGHCLTWQNGRLQIKKWYDIHDRIGDEYDDRSEGEVRSQYLELMKESVRIRFRADVPVGINLSGGLDSASLLGLVHQVQGNDSDVKAFTFVTGDDRYDELPWVRQMLKETRHRLVTAHLTPANVPELAASVQRYQDEPFGGLPTLAYAKLFDTAKEHGVTVLLDGNGMDEQWAGYDYYRSSTNGYVPAIVQGLSDSPVRPDCLVPEFRVLSEQIEFPLVFPDKLRNTQYRDIVRTKIPRAMRFNDRISMRTSRELREPFLDHRLVELALRQPPERKIADGIGKKMLRKIVAGFVPGDVSTAPKRPMQTPQREWLRGPLREWASDSINYALSAGHNDFLDRRKVQHSLDSYLRGESDNSFYIWQWITMGLTAMPLGTSSRAA